MTEMKTYLVSGANRGIGHAIAKILLSRPDTRVVVTARKQGPGFSWSSVGLDGIFDSLEMDMGDDEECSKATLAFLQRHPDIRFNAIIAAAGMVNSMEPVDQTSRQAILDHVNVNTCGVLRLWQGLGLRAFSTKGMFVALTSSCASIGQMEPLPGLAYGISKAALNFLVKKIHQEHDSVCAVAVHPGWVKTEMGQFAADAWGAKEPPMEVEDSARKVMELVDSASRANSGGRFLSYDGSEIAW